MKKFRILTNIGIDDKTKFNSQTSLYQMFSILKVVSSFTIFIINFILMQFTKNIKNPYIYK